MFRRPFMRWRRGPWGRRFDHRHDEQDEQEGEEFFWHERRGPWGHHEHSGHGHHGPFGHERHEHFGHHEGWFAQGRHNRGGPPWGRGWPPFGDDPSGEDGGGRRRHRRGDIKYVLLELLAEQPRHGYELIKELESRYAGFYRPSPGSVYPTLQMLEEEGHLTSEVIDGKRVYSVTDSGRELLQGRRPEPAEGRGGPFGRGFRRGGPPPEMHELREQGMALMAGVAQVVRHGSPEQIRAVIARLDAARRDIYAILAGSETERQGEEH